MSLLYTTINFHSGDCHYPESKRETECTDSVIAAGRFLEALKSWLAVFLLLAIYS